MRQVFYYKMRQLYYRMWQLSQNATTLLQMWQLLQNATFIKNCDSTYFIFGLPFKIESRLGSGTLRIEFKSEYMIENNTLHISPFSTENVVASDSDHNKVFSN